MTTDNRTNEQLAERLRQFAESQAMDFDNPHTAMMLNEVADRLGQLSGISGEFSEAQVEAAAKAMWDLRKLISDPEWDALEYGVKLEYRKDARAALAAAQGAEPRVDSDTQVACAVNHAGGVCPGYPHAASMQPSSAVLEAAAADAPQAPKDIHEPNHNRVYCVRCGGNWPCQPSPALPSSTVDKDELAKKLEHWIFQYNQERITLKTFARAVVEAIGGESRGEG